MMIIVNTFRRNCLRYISCVMSNTNLSMEQSKGRLPQVYLIVFRAFIQSGKADRHILTTDLIELEFVEMCLSLKFNFKNCPQCS